MLKHNSQKIKQPKYYFHVSKTSREKYKFEENLYSITGDLIVADFAAARLLSQKINDYRKQSGISDSFVTPGQINAIGLLHEIFHFIIRQYEENENPGVFERSIIFFKENIGSENLEQTLKTFVEEFPPLQVQRKEITPENYINGFTGIKANREIIIEEIILLHLENLNPAFIQLKDLFDDKPLIEKSSYKKILETAELFFEKEKPLSIENLPLLTSLKRPILTNPDNVEAQLDYIKNNWHVKVSEKFLAKLLGSKDLIYEDAKLFIQHGGVGTPPVPEYFPKLSAEAFTGLTGSIKKGESVLDDEVSLSYFEPEQFTVDTHWMPQVVMIAKNTFVWLNQLSRKYQIEIKRLDQIPDEELDQLARWNFTSLWLIGLWERSAASQKIKQFCGNPDAASSAYSLFDYIVANELGGEEAFQNLKYRCWVRGIRLASDMVPNHTGIFSQWILNHPDYFIQAKTPPYPNYAFTGPDLSDDSSIQIRIEDRYYSKQDAAVVFQMIDNRTGETRYIYHGNDGTNMPWNDTAQLNLLNPEVRESLIQMIMHVARKTSIIRFDAAMTLTKKHYSRLWFPQPGLGGAIPSRSDYSMTRNMFDSLMPAEFWREVVDRINSEMPNTLLLAEAFWLMEGYFVRSLGMHRVYNSAFMHMFMKEENAKYRQLITNTLEFNPEILKRYVNFMSNPDEETAVNQFGKGDKYFGISVMMVTLPGLPMFAHGQIEGFTEKYGMEYKRAYYNEFADDYLVHRHEKEIFPLIKLRHIFSQVDNFELYDFINENGELNDNVFAFSNIAGNDRALVFFNNAYAQTSGKIKISTGKVISGSEGIENSPIVNRLLSDAIQLRKESGYYYIVRDHKSKLEYLKSAEELYYDGYAVTLSGYQYYVFLNFKEVFDVSGEYYRLYKSLNGRGVSSVEEALHELNLVPLHSAVTDLFNKENVIYLRNNFLKEEVHEQVDSEIISLIFLKNKFLNVLNEIENFRNISIDKEKVASLLNEDLKILFNLSSFISNTSEEFKKSKPEEVSNYFILATKKNKEVYFDLMMFYVIVKRLLVTIQFVEKSESPAKLYESLMLQKPVWQALIRLGDNYEFVKQEFDLLKILASTEGIYPASEIVFADKVTSKTDRIKKPLSAINQTVLQQLIGSSEVQKFIQVNEYNGIYYYNKEYFELLLKWNFTLELIRRREKEVRVLSEKQKSINEVFASKHFITSINEMVDFTNSISKASEEAGYKFIILTTLITSVYQPKITKEKKEIAKKTKKKKE
jgi:glycosidase